MSLNISQGNMYSWVTHTWNTIKGECPHGCTYCYMHRWGKQKPVHFDGKELKTDLGEGNFIFVGSSCDMFAYTIPHKWIEKTFSHCCKFDNTYLFQSKNPSYFYSAGFWPEKYKLCTTIETNRDYNSIMGKAPFPISRAEAMSRYLTKEKYVTIEPIMDFDLTDMVDLIKMCNPVQVNIGADSGNNNLPEPSKDKLLALIDELKKFTVIDKKTNLKRLLR
jgi:hypothetical protein